MTGDILLMTKKAYPAVYATQRREIEAQVVTQANNALASLVNDTRLIYDGSQNTLTYRAMLVSQSKTPHTPSTAVGLQIDSNNPIPKLRFEFRFPKLEGALPVFNYTALDVKIVFELTPKPNIGQSPQPLRVLERNTNWNRVLGTGLLVLAGAIVVGTLVEDFFTAGAGTLDDPASFAAAGASVARGLQLVRAGAALLPAATVGASVALTLSLSPSGVASGQIQR